MTKRRPNNRHRITVREVAKAAGVHFSTVSRVMNPATRGQITEIVADRVLKAADRLGYRTNALASSLRTRRSRVVGVIVPDINSLLFPPILLGLEQVLIEKGYVSILCNTENDAARNAMALSEMIGRRIDGLVLATAMRHDPTIEEWAERGVPLVLINRTDESGRVPSVITDDRLGISLAVNHLAQLGHAQIGHVAGPPETSTGTTRSEGFHAAMAKLRLRADAASTVFADAFNREAGRKACHQLLNQQRDLTAIVAANDMLALGCYDALRERGLSCPQDVSVTGYNDIPFIDMVSPPLTTVRIPQREIGIQAARVLLQRIENESGSEANVVLRPDLVVRQSTAAPRKPVGRRARKASHALA